MNATTITLYGNLASDVDFRTTARGEAMARFRVASTSTRYDRAAARWVDGDTTFWTVTVWRRAAENARDSLAKGHPVVVHGRVRQRTVDREVPGSPGTTMPVTFTDIDAVHFGLDLSRCRATYQRAPLGPQTRAEVGPDHGDADRVDTAPVGPGGDVGRPMASSVRSPGAGDGAAA